MKLHILPCLRLQSLATLQTLGLVAGMVISFSSIAAVKDTQNLEQEAVDTAITPVSSAQNKEGDKKSLANEPAPLGKLLYENHCISCHESMVHIRGAHKAKTYEDVQYWVGRWAVELDVKWTADEIDAVVQHLNDTFYRY